MKTTALNRVELNILLMLHNAPEGVRAPGHVPCPVTKQEIWAAILRRLSLMGYAVREDISVIAGTGIAGQTFIYRVNQQGRQEIAQLRGRA